MRMDSGWVLRGLVLCILVRRILMQRLRRTMMLSPAKGWNSNHHCQQPHKNQLLHAKNLPRHPSCRLSHFRPRKQVRIKRTNAPQRREHFPLSPTAPQIPTPSAQARW